MTAINETRNSPARSQRVVVKIAPAWLDARLAAEHLGVSLRTFRDLAKTEGFPAAKTLGPRSTRWRTADLDAYMDQLPDFRPGTEPAELVAGRAARAAGRSVLPGPFVG